MEAIPVRGAGLMRVVSPDALLAAERAFAASREQLYQDSREVGLTFANSLAGHIQRCFNEADEHKRQLVAPQLEECARQRRGKYSDAQLQEIGKQGGSDIFINLTNVKCRAAEAWIKDVVLSGGDQPWTIEATPIPDLPMELEQAVQAVVTQEAQAVLVAGEPVHPEAIRMRAEGLREELMIKLADIARRRAQAMEKRIADQLAEGKFAAAFKQFINDFTTYPTAFIKGPVVVRRKRLEYVGGQPTVREQLVREFVRVSPFDLYPAPDATTTDDGYVIERHRLRASELQSLIGVPGYREDKIRETLARYGTNGYVVTRFGDLERDLIENRPSGALGRRTTIEALQFWGPVSGSMLKEWAGSEAAALGYDGLVDELFYEVEAWLIGSCVIRAVLNPDPFGRRAYHHASWDEVPGSVWGGALPELMTDLQRMINASGRALNNNLAIACLTGDTVVYRHGQDRQHAPVTLDQLWEKKHQHNSGLRRTKLRALDEQSGEFIDNRIVDIVDNGVAEVFAVTTAKGYRIRATGNHRFLNQAGDWQPLDDFVEGDLIGVNGQVLPLPQECLDCGAPTSRRGVRCRACASRVANSSWNQRQVELAAANREASATTARMRWACQSQKKDFCDQCGARAADLEVHHRDRDPWNNVPDNLRTLCSPCHHALHAREDSFGDPYLHRYLSYDRIVSIVPAGRERVFDLQMTAPHHNFVANGFVSHNSGPQCEINIDRLPEGVLDIEEIYPWKIWQTRSDRSGTGQPAVRFFQPDSRAAELLATIRELYTKADEVTGIPNYTYGSTAVGGAGRTASGLSMLMDNAAKGLKNALSNLDVAISGLIGRLYQHNILFDPDPMIKGDCRVVAKGALGLIAREALQARRNEFLQATTNPADLQILGTQGRAYLLREMAKGLQLDTNKIVPDPERLQALLAAAQQALPAGPAPVTQGATLDAAGSPLADAQALPQPEAA